jgi:hypothetical protein
MTNRTEQFRPDFAIIVQLLLLLLMLLLLNTVVRITSLLLLHYHYYYIIIILLFSMLSLLSLQMLMLTHYFDKYLFKLKIIWTSDRENTKNRAKINKKKGKKK